VGFVWNWLRGQGSPVVAAAEAATTGRTFSTSIDSGVLYGTPTLDSYIRRSGKVARKLALTVPAVKRARDIIAGSIGQMPIRMVGPDGKAVDWSLFAAPEAGVAASITWTRVAEDLLFDGVAWLSVTHLGWHGKPVEVVRLDPDTVTVQPETRVFHGQHGNGSAEVWPVDSLMIRIDSPNPALLEVGARAIRTCLALGDTTLNVASGLPPMTYFAPADPDVDPFPDAETDEEEQEEIQALLDAWAALRAKNATGYVPAALKLHTLGWNPEQLQLTSMRDQAVLDIARHTSIDAEEFGVSTTSRTYQNQQDRRRDRLDFTLGPYLTAMEGRLSLPDVSPRGYRAQIDPAAFLRADDKTRAETDAALVKAEILTVDEVREQRGLPPLPASAAERTRTTEPELEETSA